MRYFINPRRRTSKYSETNPCIRCFHSPVALIGRQAPWRQASVCVCPWLCVLVLITVISPEQFWLHSDGPVRAEGWSVLCEDCLLCPLLSTPAITLFMPISFYSNPHTNTGAFHLSKKIRIVFPSLNSWFVSCSTLYVAEMTGKWGEIAQSKGFEAGRHNLPSWCHLIDLERVPSTVFDFSFFYLQYENRWEQWLQHVVATILRSVRCCFMCIILHHILFLKGLEDLCRSGILLDLK